MSQISQWIPRNYYILRNRTSGIKYIGQTVKSLSRYLGSGLYWRNHCKSNGGFSRKNIEVLWNKFFTSESDAAEFLQKFEEANPNYWTEEVNEWANLVKENTLDNPKGNKSTGKKSADTKRLNGSYANIGKKISAALTGKPNPKVAQSRKEKCAGYDSEGNYHLVSKEDFVRLGLTGLRKGIRPEHLDTEEYRRRLSERMKNRVWVKCGNDRKLIEKHEVTAYIDRGYVLGYGEMPKRQLITCANCGKECDAGNYSRWHGPKCSRIKKI